MDGALFHVSRWTHVAVAGRDAQTGLGLPLLCWMTFSPGSRGVVSAGENPISMHDLPSTILDWEIGPRAQTSRRPPPSSPGLVVAAVGQRRAPHGVGEPDRTTTASQPVSILCPFQVRTRRIADDKWDSAPGSASGKERMKQQNQLFAISRYESAISYTGPDVERSKREEKQVDQTEAPGARGLRQSTMWLFDSTCRDGSPDGGKFTIH